MTLEDNSSVNTDTNGAPGQPEGKLDKSSERSDTPMCSTGGCGTRSEYGNTSAGRQWRLTQPPTGFTGITLRREGRVAIAEGNIEMDRGSPVFHRNAGSGEWVGYRTFQAAELNRIDVRYQFPRVETLADLDYLEREPRLDFCEVASAQLNRIKQAYGAVSTVQLLPLRRINWHHGRRAKGLVQVGHRRGRPAMAETYPKQKAALYQWQIEPHEVTEKPAPFMQVQTVKAKAGKLGTDDDDGFVTPETAWIAMEGMTKVMSPFAMLDLARTFKAGTKALTDPEGKKILNRLLTEIQRDIACQHRDMGIVTLVNDPSFRTSMILAFAQSMSHSSIPLEDDDEGKQQTDTISNLIRWMNAIPWMVVSRAGGLLHEQYMQKNPELVVEANVAGGDQDYVAYAKRVFGDAHVEDLNLYQSGGKDSAYRLDLDWVLTVFRKTLCLLLQELSTANKRRVVSEITLRSPVQYKKVESALSGLLELAEFMHEMVKDQHMYSPPAAALRLRYPDSSVVFWPMVKPIQYRADKVDLQHPSLVAEPRVVMPLQSTVHSLTHPFTLPNDPEGKPVPLDEQYSNWLVDYQSRSADRDMRIRFLSVVTVDDLSDNVITEFRDTVDTLTDGVGSIFLFKEGMMQCLTHGMNTSPYNTVIEDIKEDVEGEVYYEKENAKNKTIKHARMPTWEHQQHLKKGGKIDSLVDTYEVLDPPVVTTYEGFDKAVNSMSGADKAAVKLYIETEVRRRSAGVVDEKSPPRAPYPGSGLIIPMARSLSLSSTLECLRQRTDGYVQILTDEDGADRVLHIGDVRIPSEYLPEAVKDIPRLEDFSYQPEIFMGIKQIFFDHR